MNGDSNKTISNENLIIVLHGFGDSKKPFLDLPQKWTLEKTAFLFLDGNDKLPQELTGSDNSYSWFEYFDMNTGDYYPDDSEKARNNCKKSLFSKLFPLLESLQDNSGWKAEQIFLFGFSQGGTYALEALLQQDEYRRVRRDELTKLKESVRNKKENNIAHPRWAFSSNSLFGGIIGISTVLLGASRKAVLSSSRNKEEDGVSASSRQVPILLIHGENDDQLSIAHNRETKEALSSLQKRNSQSNEKHVLIHKTYPNRGHTMLRGTHAEEMRVFYEFVANHFCGVGKDREMKAMAAMARKGEVEEIQNVMK